MLVGFSGLIIILFFSIVPRKRLSAALSPGPRRGEVSTARSLQKANGVYRRDMCCDPIEGRWTLSSSLYWTIQRIVQCPGGDCTSSWRVQRKPVTLLKDILYCPQPSWGILYLLDPIEGSSTLCSEDWIVHKDTAWTLQSHLIVISELIKGYHCLHQAGAYGRIIRIRIYR